MTYGSYFGLNVDPAIIQKELDLKSPQPKEHPVFGNLFRKNFMFSLIRNNIGRLPLANHINIDLTAPINTLKTGLTMTSELVEAPSSPPLSESLQVALTEAPLPANSQNLMITTDSNAVVKQLTDAHLASKALIGTIENTPKAKSVAPVSMMMFNDGISPISSSLWLGRYTQSTNGSSIPVDRLWSALKSLKGSRQARLFAGLDHRNWMDGTTRTGQELIQDLLNPDEPPRTVFDWIVYDLMT